MALGAGIVRLLIAITLVALAGCGGAPVPTPTSDALVAVPTAPPQVPDAEGNVACPAAAFAGTLVAHPEWGVALRSQEGVVSPYVWPHGYVARATAGGIELLNEDGEVIAREGDLIEGGGGMARMDGIGEAFYVCPIRIDVTRADE